MRLNLGTRFWTLPLSNTGEVTFGHHPHLYFQAPGGQCLRLVGIDEDMSFYEGAGAGPDVSKVKDAIQKEAREK